MFGWLDEIKIVLSLVNGAFVSMSGPFAVAFGDAFVCCHIMQVLG